MLKNRNAVVVNPGPSFPTANPVPKAAVPARRPAAFPTTAATSGPLVKSRSLPAPKATTRAALPAIIPAATLLVATAAIAVPPARGKVPSPAQTAATKTDYAAILNGS